MKKSPELVELEEIIKRCRDLTPYGTARQILHAGFTKSSKVAINNLLRVAANND